MLSIVKKNKVAMFIFLSTIVTVLIDVFILINYNGDVALKYYMTSKVNYSNKYILVILITLLQCIPIGVAKYTNYLEKNKKYLIALQTIILCAFGYILLMNCL